MKFDFRKTLDGYKSVDCKEAERLLEIVLEQLKENGIWGNKDYKKGDDVRFLFTLGKVNEKLAINIFYSINQSEWKYFFINDFTYNNDDEAAKVFSFLKDILQEDGYNIANITVEGQNEPTAFAIAI